MFESLKDTTAKLAAARAAAKEAFSDIAKGAFAEFFAAHPEIEAVKWTQYTPYFNDGDACVFRVNDWGVKPVAPDAVPSEDDDEEDEDGDNGFRDSWDLKNAPATKSAADDLNSLFGLLDDELMQAAFGEHSKVIASRSGFAVSEYEHD